MNVPVKQDGASSRRPNRLRDRYGPWAVVTGASSGIGQAFAVELAEAGFDLLLVARRGDVLQEIAEDLTARFRIEARVVAADLATAEGLRAVEAAAEGLAVGLLVASAGFGTSGSFLRAQQEQEFEMLDLNCRAVLSQSLSFGRRFCGQQRGGIILLASLLGFQGAPWSAHYAATKAYVQVLAEGLREEFRASGVDVLSSAPGPVRTGFAERAGMHMSFALAPRTVARASLNALGRKTTVWPGLLSWVLLGSLAPLPRWIRTRIMGAVMQSMTKA